MAALGPAVLAIGGFDEHLFAAEDVDLGYRWIGAGGRISYAPELVVWHTDWRTDDDLKDLCLAYSYGGGMFHAKHLRKGDWRVLPWLASDVLRAGRDFIRRPIAPRSRSWWDESRVFTSGYLMGLRTGWRVFGANRADALGEHVTPNDPRGARRDA
jgi:GT2 family glycosyltransferase